MTVPQQPQQQPHHPAGGQASPPASPFDGPQPPSGQQPGADVPPVMSSTQAPPQAPPQPPGQAPSQQYAPAGPPPQPTQQPSPQGRGYAAAPPQTPPAAPQNAPQGPPAPAAPPAAPPQSAGQPPQSAPTAFDGSQPPQQYAAPAQQHGGPPQFTKAPAPTATGGGEPQAAPHSPTGPGVPGGFPVTAPYQSSMAVSKTHLGHALASEWTKIRSVRSTVWALVAMFLTSVGIGSVVAVGVGSASYSIMPVLGPGFYGLMLGQLAIISLGVLVITAEYSTGMVRTTMTACPRRTRVLTAKAIIFFLLSFVMTLVATALVGLVSSALLSGKEVSDVISNEESIAAGESLATSSEWFGATVGASLYVALLGVSALALGALLRSAPAAITIMMGLVMLPPVVSLFLMASERTQDLSENLREYSPLNGLSSMHRMSMVESDTTGWPLLGLLAIATAVLLAAAYTRLATRDV